MADPALVPDGDQRGVIDRISELDGLLDDAIATYRTTDMTGREERLDEVENLLTEYRELRDAQMVPALPAGESATYLRLRQDEVPQLTQATPPTRWA